ncbi:c-type cytochrome [Herbaspirillum rhizosphaerae]|uniref:c-type cytochrome n=1 Tax=Herbaspirillum rhizosphaerae TaxID=346179 RepID=UPI00067ADD9E|nr:cytochrome c [Herbaspirillum rhizosphaerae]
MSRFRSLSIFAMACCATILFALPAAQAQIYRIGRAAGERDLAAWNIDVAADGAGLPKGSGSVERGRSVYAQQCAACHGARGEGGLADQLVGGKGSLATAKPVKTIGSFWPYATTVFDFINRAMPYNAPQSLSADEVYAVTAYLLNLNGIVADNAVLDAQALPKVRMPNRDGFINDSRPDTANVACQKNCRPSSAAQP